MVKVIVRIKVVTLVPQRLLIAATTVFYQLVNFTHIYVIMLASNMGDNNVKTISNLLNLLDGKLPQDLLCQLKKCVADYGKGIVATGTSELSNCGIPLTIKSEYARFLSEHNDHMTFLLQKRESKLFQLLVLIYLQLHL